MAWGYLFSFLDLALSLLSHLYGGHLCDFTHGCGVAPVEISAGGALVILSISSISKVEKATSVCTLQDEPGFFFFFLQSFSR